MVCIFVFALYDFIYLLFICSLFNLRSCNLTSESVLAKILLSETLTLAAHTDRMELLIAVLASPIHMLASGISGILPNAKPLSLSTVFAYLSNASLVTSASISRTAISPWTPPKTAPRLPFDFKTFLDANNPLAKSTPFRNDFGAWISTNAATQLVHFRRVVRRAHSKRCVL